MKCVSVGFRLFKWLNTQCLFPSAQNCSEGSLLRPGVVFKTVFISSSYKQQKVLPCLSWSSGGTAQGEKSKFLGSDLTVLPGLQLLSRTPCRKSCCQGTWGSWGPVPWSVGTPNLAAVPTPKTSVVFSSILVSHAGLAWLCTGLNPLDLSPGGKSPSHPKHFWWQGCSILCHTGEFVCHRLQLQW